MSCCGANRRLAASLRAAPPVAVEETPTAERQGLRYTGNAILTVRGPFSDRLYRLDPARRRIEAEAADVAALLRTGLFAGETDGARSRRK